MESGEAGAVKIGRKPFHFHGGSTSGGPSSQGRRRPPGSAEKPGRLGRLVRVRRQPPFDLPVATGESKKENRRYWRPLGPRRRSTVTRKEGVASERCIPASQDLSRRRRPLRLAGGYPGSSRSPPLHKGLGRPL